jgi:DNA-binding protein HU-beta
MNLTKAELVDKMAEAAGITKKAADQALGGLLDAVSESLGKGGKVSIIGFGTWSVSERKARTGRNPQTGKPISIAASKGVKFKAGTKLAEKVK